MLARLAEMEAHFKTSAQAQTKAVEVDPDARARPWPAQRRNSG